MSGASDTSDRRIWAMSGAEQARAIRERRLSAREVTAAVLERIAVLNPLLNGYCTLAEDAATEAAAADAALQRGETVGPLHGVPVSIKDLVLTRGMRTTFGSKLYEQYVPDEDDVAVARLRTAGAIVIGKTNVPEFGYNALTDNLIFGPTRNPWHTALSAGGSSGGAAAAVAAGMGSLALGSDGGGSIRTPAALCGVFGIKPTFGRVPLYPGCRVPEQPGASGWESLEVLGPITRTVEDAALMLSVMAGEHPRDRHSLPGAAPDYLAGLHDGVAGLRVAWSAGWGYVQVDEEVARVAAAAAQLFADQLGCTVEAAHPGFADSETAFRAIVAAGTDLTSLRRYAREHPGEIGEVLLAVLQQEWTAEEFTDAAMARQRLVNQMHTFMARYDLVLSPTAPVTAFPLQPGRIRIGHFTFPFNLTGQPAASVPAGFTSSGLPVGLQIAGRRLADATVLRAAAAFEQARPWRDRWPVLAPDTAGNPASVRAAG